MEIFLTFSGNQTLHLKKKKTQEGLIKYLPELLLWLSQIWVRTTFGGWACMCIGQVDLGCGHCDRACMLPKLPSFWPIYRGQYGAHWGHRQYSFDVPNAANNVIMHRGSELRVGGVCYMFVKEFDNQMKMWKILAPGDRTNQSLQGNIFSYWFCYWTTVNNSNSHNECSKCQASL